MTCKIKKSWINSELIHGDTKLAKRIVRQHITEHGCNYYPSLFRMEKRLSKR